MWNIFGACIHQGEFCGGSLYYSIGNDLVRMEFKSFFTFFFFLNSILHDKGDEGRISPYRISPPGTLDSFLFGGAIQYYLQLLHVASLENDR